MSIQFIKLEVNMMEKVKLIRENGVSVITFNRPENYNALDVDTLKGLLEIVEEVEANDDQVVILTGEGKAFSAGGDIGMMQEMNDPAGFDRMMGVLEDITLKLYTMRKIVISAVNGSAAGLGLSIALNADYIVANKDAKFGMLFAGIGLIPDGGGHFLLKERLGTHRAKQFIWGLQQVAGEQAKEMGFTDIITDGDAKEAAMLLAAKLQTSPLQAIIETKLIFHEGKQEELQYYLQKEKQGQLKMRSTEDHQEGVAAFLAKRRPNFKGK